MQWTVHMVNTINYIEEHLIDVIDYNHVAKIACCSIDTFQRVFSCIFNMSLSEYVRNRKLTMAAIDLQRSKEKIIDIAFKYGYESNESFTRAFNKFHGVLPSAVKNENASYKYCSKAMVDIKITGGIVMNYVQAGENSCRDLNHKKIIETVLEVPQGDETCRFASCFTSLYMCIENEYDKQSDNKRRHNQLYNFFQFISGGVHGTPNSSRKNSYEYAMEYCGYDYIKLGKSDGPDKLRYAVVSSINQNMPVLLSLDNSNDNWNIITGYNENANIIYGYNGDSSYWKDIETDMNIVVDGYLDNHMYYLSNWFETVDFIVVVVNKSKPKVNNIDVFKQLIVIIGEENAIYEKNIIDIQDDRAISMNEDELRILFNDCMGMIYQQMDTRHKLNCAFKEILYPNMPEVGNELLEAAETLGAVGNLGFQLFSVLGDGWPVFMHPENYMCEFRKPELRQNMAYILRQIVETNIVAIHKIENIISKLLI